MALDRFAWVAILSFTQNLGVAMISFGVALDNSQCLISSGVARDQFWGVHYKFKSVTRIILEWPVITFGVLDQVWGGP